ncbi:MAG: 50S ribosomal protein L2 [Minisyncoccia bacterium]
MKKFKPTTKSRRGMTVQPFKEYVTTNTPEKSLTSGFKRGVGRNHHGRITVQHKGGGHKRIYRDVDFTYNKIDIPYTVKSVEYDPNRTGYIGLVFYRDGAKRYILLPKTVKVDDVLLTSEKAPETVGNRLPLHKLTVGTYVYNISLKKDGPAKVARSAGSFAEIVAKDGDWVDVKMPSTEIRKIHKNAWASIGEVSNSENRLVNLGKAGRSRWLGIRPTVRGSAMNPVDHPYGGGEGRSGRGHRRARTRHGKPTGKGQKSRRAKKYSNVFVVSRRRVGKKK